MVVGVLVSVTMFASEINNPSTASGVAVIRKTGTSTYNLIYKALLTTNVKVAIYDVKDQLVFSETLRKTNGFARPYNFDGLAEGEYTIRVSDADREHVEKVSYRSGKLKSLVNIVKLNEGDKYFLTVAGKGEQRISVNIYDAAGTLIHNESNMMYDSFGQVYDLSSLKGSITFEIADNIGMRKSISFK